ncbi:MAG: PA2169 family four-helix-bundle protein [Candidatus Obscuribacterales bacterium]|nr:PA2169 family four-helix-bundle protein [Candidatus Obscuribacterales bacterium]
MKENLSIKDLLGRKFLHQREVNALSSLLAGEIAAVNAYGICLRKAKDLRIIPPLEECKSSHALRIPILKQQLQMLGEEPLDSAGLWGMVCELVESGALFIGDRVAVSVLTAGEDFGFEQYEEHMKDLDNESYLIAEQSLLPAQANTLRTMTLLCAWIRSQEHEAAIEMDKQAASQRSQNSDAGMDISSSGSETK